jgi:prolyl oligopeptidase
MTSGEMSRSDAATMLPPKPGQARQDNVVEMLHGVEIADPYRWLEDQDSPPTRAWIEEQDAYTRALLAQMPHREQIARRLTELSRIDSTGIPTVRNGVYFFSRRRVEDELPIVYRRVGLDGADEVLLDPHTLSEDRSVSISLLDISQDGSLLAYGIRQGGEDEIEIHFMDVATRADLPDVLPRDRYMNVALTPDKRALYYANETDNGPRAYRHLLNYPAGENGQTTGEQKATEGAEDIEIFGQGYEKGKFLTVNVSENGRYLLFTVYYGSAATKTDLYVQRLDLPADAPAPIVPLITTIAARFGGDVGGDRLYLQTNWDAPNERVLAVDLDQLDLTHPNAAPLSPDRFHEIIPTRDNAVLEGFSLAGHHLVANYLEDVRSRVQVFDASGAYIRDIELPTLGSASGLYGQWDRPETFYTFTSFAYPAVIFRYDVQTGASGEWARMDVPIDPARFEVRQVFYTSKDGTRIPMFLLHLKELPLDGARPTLLYGYGGFTASLTPFFSSFATLWAEHGGVYAVANLRGGGEYGEEWHRAGMLANKQNTFDDFIAAAEYLTTEKYTNPDKLAIMGGSNGGLLVGAALTQRPEMFRAVICAVPLLDMVRYHQFLVARYWVPEYGSSEDPEQFETLYAYSPYHRVVQGTHYPAVLFVTGDADTRVAPLHARKMAALLQSATGSEHPILLHYDTKSGHMGTRPVGKVIEDTTDQLCFLFSQLEVKPL